MSDTPETDAALYPMNGVDIVWPEFARKLERERDEAREAFVIATDQMVVAQCKVREVSKERDEAREQAQRFRSLHYSHLGINRSASWFPWEEKLGHE